MKPLFSPRFFHSCFFALLRVSEVAHTPGTGSRHALQYSGVIFHVDNQGNCITLHIPSSKTDQLSRGTSICLRPYDNKAIYPIANATLFLQHRSTAVGQFFIHADERPISAYQVSSVLHKCLEFCHIPLPELYTTHSFRIGACSTLSQQGLSADSIRSAGRWRSSAFKRYIRDSHVSPWQ